MKVVILIALLSTFLLSSCGTEKEVKKEEQATFFDLKTYFETELNRLAAANVSIKKSITNKGKVEQKKINDLDWKAELALFVRGDINKPSWIEKYTVDSTFNTNQQLTQLLYQTNDEEMYTQVLDIKFQENKVHSIIIVNNVNNAVYASQQYLKYIPSLGYSIDKTQDVTLFDKETYKVEVEFLKP